MIWINEPAVDPDRMTLCQPDRRDMDKTFAAPCGSDSAGCRRARSDSGCDDCRMRPFSICAALAPSELDELDRISHTRAFPAKAMLFDQGETADSVFNLVEGMVRLYKSLPDGRRQIVGFALPGDFLGLALMEGYGVAAEAVTDVKVCRFARPVFLNYVEAKPHLLRRMHEFAGHELSLAHDQMLLLGRRTADEKIAAFLLGLQRRYARTGTLTVHVPLPMSRQDIADYLGLTIETVSRTLTKFARDKIIVVVPDGVRLLGLARLDRLAAA
ncbi:MAG: Crp/Fnr family transcriptional regulator [Tardiphaga sp.]